MAPGISATSSTFRHGPPGQNFEREALPSVAELRPIRVDRLDLDDLAALGRDLEPFLTDVRQRLHNDEFSEFEALSVEHSLNGLDSEMWRNPGERSPGVIAGHTAQLFRLVGGQLPPRSGANDAATAAARQALEYAGQLDSATADDSASEVEATVDALTDVVEALMDAKASDDDTEDTPHPIGQPAHMRAWSRVHQALRWGIAPGGAAGVGAATSQQLITALFKGFSPAWAAALGAVAGLVASTFFPSQQGPMAPKLRLREARSDAILVFQPVHEAWRPDPSTHNP